MSTNILALTERPAFTNREDAEIYDLYGSALVNSIGLDRIRNIPVVSAQEVDLEMGPLYSSSHIGGYSLRYPIYRGRDGLNHAFI